MIEIVNFSSATNEVEPIVSMSRMVWRKSASRNLVTIRPLVRHSEESNQMTRIRIFQVCIIGASMALTKKERKFKKITCFVPHGTEICTFSMTMIPRQEKALSDTRLKVETIIVDLTMSTSGLSKRARLQLRMTVQ